MSHVFDSLRKATGFAENGSRPIHLQQEATLFSVSRNLRHVSVSLKPENHILSGSDRQNEAREHFKYVEHELRGLRKRSPVKKILVTSSAPREGKTVVATNLATTLAAGADTVLLVDGDMRAAGRGNLFGLGSAAGLADALEGRAEANDVLTYLDELGIYYAPSGIPTSSPGDLVHGPSLGGFLKAMDDFDWIIIDSPPIATFADALSLATHVDTTVLVARAGLTGRNELQSAVDALKANHTSVAAVVLNACDQGRNHRGYYSYYKATPAER